MDWASLFAGAPIAARSRSCGETIATVTSSASASTARARACPEGCWYRRRQLPDRAPRSRESHATGGDFDRLPIPFRAVAADLADGERVILSRGDLARAVRASMSIPVFFPVTWEGRLLVDGLIVDNMPTGVARTFGATVTVAIDVGSPSWIRRTTRARWVWRRR